MKGIFMNLLMIGVVVSVFPQVLNNDSCRYAFDGECDDGGPGSTTNACTYGTDVNDCGFRGAPVSKNNPVSRKVPNDNSCVFANDGDCDDGGPGSINNVCTYGTDVNDCGYRAQ